MKFLFFGKKKVKGKNELLNGLLNQTEVNLANNYKDEAQRNFKAFREAFEKVSAEGGLDEKQQAYYGEKLQDLSGKMDHFTHADQKPYWTKE